MLFIVLQVSNFINIQQKKDKNMDRDIAKGILDGIRSNIRWMDNHSNELYSYLIARKSVTRAEN